MASTTTRRPAPAPIRTYQAPIGYAIRFRDGGVTVITGPWPYRR